MLQARARPEATIDQSRVPAGLRRMMGAPRKLTSEQVQTAFEAGHGSVNGHSSGNSGGGGTTEAGRRKAAPTTASENPGRVAETAPIKKTQSGERRQEIFTDPNE